MLIGTVKELPQEALTELLKAINVVINKKIIEYYLVVVIIEHVLGKGFVDDIVPVQVGSAT